MWCGASASCSACEHWDSSCCLQLRELCSRRNLHQPSPALLSMHCTVLLASSFQSSLLSCIRYDARQLPTRLSAHMNDIRCRQSVSQTPPHSRNLPYTLTQAGRHTFPCACAHPFLSNGCSFQMDVPFLSDGCSLPFRQMLNSFATEWWGTQHPTWCILLRHVQVGCPSPNMFVNIIFRCASDAGDDTIALVATAKT
jgi:hypothetical protein